MFWLVWWEEDGRSCFLRFSLKKRITPAFKNRVDFGWLRSSGCLLHHQEAVSDIVRSVTSGASEGTNHWLKQLARGVQRQSSKFRHTSRLEGKYIASSFCLIFIEVHCKVCDITHRCWKLLWRALHDLLNSYKNMCAEHWFECHEMLTWFWTSLEWEISWHKNCSRRSVHLDRTVGLHYTVRYVCWK